MSESNKCRICKTEATYDQPGNEFTFYCQKCKICSICHNFGDPTNNESLTLEELEFAAKYNQTPAHFICQSEGMRKEIENSPRTISAKHLDWLNSLHLMFGINEELSKESNIVEATYAANRFLVGKSPTQLYLHLKRIEAITAVLSIALKRDRKSVELALDAEESKKYKAATSKQDVAERTQAPNKAQKKSMGKRDTGIANLMKFGMDYETAASTYDKAQETLA